MPPPPNAGPGWGKGQTPRKCVICLEPWVGTKYSHYGPGSRLKDGTPYTVKDCKVGSFLSRERARWREEGADPSKPPLWRRKTEHEIQQAQQRGHCTWCLGDHANRDFNSRFWCPDLQRLREAAGYPPMFDPSTMLPYPEYTLQNNVRAARAQGWEPATVGTTDGTE